MESLPVFVILYAGIIHALEADHILAVSNIVSQRKAVIPAIKDGIFWGLGHTSTILLIGVAILIFKSSIPEEVFSYFEAAVGLMLVLVGIYRLFKFYKKDDRHPSGFHAKDKQKLHKVSYGIGAVHGLAGSGALVLLAMTQFKETSTGMLYLLLYGIGSVIGMGVVSGLFSIPFSQKIINNQLLSTILILMSSGVCIVYGIYVMYDNLS